MKSNVPWSVKGIDPEARVVAKEAARKAGMTLGEWMSTMIREVGNEDTPQNNDNAPVKSTGVSPEQLRAVVESLNRLNERLRNTEESIKRSEEKSIQAVGGLNQGLETVFERLKRMEREKREGVSPEISDRIDRLEKTEGERDRIENLKVLEQALTQLVEQFEATRHEALARVEENEKAVHDLRGRVDHLDTRLTAGFQEVHDALDTVGRHLDQTERTAKAVMLEAKEAATSTDEEFVERTGKKLQLLGNEIKRSGDQIAAVEAMVSSLSDKIEAAEHRSAEGISEVAAELGALRDEIMPALNDAGAARDAALSAATSEAEETVASLQRSYEEMLARLEGQTPPSEDDALEDEADEDEDGGAEALSPPAAASRAAAAAAADTTPTVSDPISEDLPASDDDEFDAVFEQTAVEDDSDPIGTAINDADTPTIDDTDEDDEEDATPPDAKMTSREKILAAAKARRERLAREQEADVDSLLDQDAEEAATDADDDINATPLAAAPKTSRVETPSVDEDGQNRRLGLPLVALLGLLVAAMAVGGVLFFGIGGSPDMTAADDVEAVDSFAEDTADPVSTNDVSQIEPTAQAPAPAIAASPDGATLYARGKSMLAEATNLEEQAAAFNVIREAAIYGSVPAQYRLGEMYFVGTGTPQDLENAKRWFTDAANAGNAPAMHRLGTLAIDPNVDGQNFTLALDWFTKAANHGVIDSMYNLGYLYDPSSDLLPRELRDAEQSYYWYALAARQGDAQAEIDGVTVASTLPRDAVSRIDGDIAAWAPNRLNPAANDGIQIAN